MVYEFEFHRPSYYNSRIFSSYYPVTKSNRSSAERPFSSARYYKPYWSYNPYIPLPSSYGPYTSNYLYNLPFYSYRYVNPKLPSLTEILARKEVDRFRNCARSKCVELEVDNFDFSSYNASTERVRNATRASSVPRFVRESSVPPSFDRFLRSSLERDLF
ncbi:hypothetical protein HA402_012880 [Bradysia odoriphaga]|nr:hypothetical protein HA402_012880 [Bradysia odoriphaga]